MNNSKAFELLESGGTLVLKSYGLKKCIRLLKVNDDLSVFACWWKDDPNKIDFNNSLVLSTTDEWEEVI
jgi:hypothetical protein